MSARNGNNHGWVFPRADGAFAKCGGPRVCHECQLDAAAKANAMDMPLAARLAFAREIAGEDWTAVPRVATRAMMQAAFDRPVVPKGTKFAGEIYRTIYQAMLAASEKEPGQ